MLVTSGLLVIFGPSVFLFRDFTRAAAHNPGYVLLSGLALLLLARPSSTNVELATTTYVAIEMVARQEGFCGQVELLLRQGGTQTPSTASS